MFRIWEFYGDGQMYHMGPYSVEDLHSGLSRAPLVPGEYLIYEG